MGLTIHWTRSTQRELSDTVVRELVAKIEEARRVIQGEAL